MINKLSLKFYEANGAQIQPKHTLGSHDILGIYFKKMHTFS